MESTSGASSGLEHWPQCIVLSVASELLACGVDDLLAEGMARISPSPAVMTSPHNSGDLKDTKRPTNIFTDYIDIEANETAQFTPLLRLAIVILISQMSDIRRSLQRLTALAIPSSSSSHISGVESNDSKNQSEERWSFCQTSFTAMQQPSTLPPLTSAGVPLQPTQNSLLQNRSLSSTINKDHTCWRHVEIDRDIQRGRFVRTQQALGPGITVCSDRAYLLSLSSPCKCRYHAHSTTDNDRRLEDTMMPLLVEHLSLAACLYNKLSISSKLNTSQLSSETTLPISIDSHMKAYFTLLDGHLPSHISDDKIAPGDNIQISWSPQQLRVFAIISALMILMDEDGNMHTQEESSIDADNSKYCQHLKDDLNDIRTQWKLVDASFKNRMTTKALLFFRILVRLPTNTHAVSMIQQTVNGKDKNGDCNSAVMLESKIIAYAVFLQASAINHSCEANTTIRYSVANSEDALTADVLVDKLQVDIITTKDAISYGEEITCCYGPLYPRHSLRQRQVSLQNQYLFHCHCSACGKETAQLMATKSQQYVTNNQDADQTRRLRQKQLYQQLQQLSEDVLEINVAWTTLMTQSPGQINKSTSAPSNLSLVSVLTDNLQHLCRVANIPDTSTTHVSNTPQPHHLNKSSNEMALVQLWQLLQYLENSIMRETILVGAFGPLIYQELCSLQCDTDDKQAADRFRSLSFRHHNFFPATSSANNNNNLDKPLFQPHSVMWKECFSIWCLLLDIQAQMLSSLPVYIHPLLNIHPNMVSSKPSIKMHMLQAARCVNFAINLMIAGGLYDPQDIVIARERVKAASLYLSAGDWARSRRRASLAIRVLRIHCGNLQSVDPDLQEAQHIVTLTEEKSSPMLKKGNHHWNK